MTDRPSLCVTAPRAPQPGPAEFGHPVAFAPDMTDIRRLDGALCYAPFNSLFHHPDDQAAAGTGGPPVVTRSRRLIDNDIAAATRHRAPAPHQASV
jgi:hypothetical protein